MYEDIIAQVIQTYGGQLWLGFVTLVITGFVLTLVKNFIQDLVNYFRAKMSDIGYGQLIYWDKQIYAVDRITFKSILVKDDERMIYIPIDKYLSSAREYPLSRYDDFDENKYHQKPWNGANDRRQVKQPDRPQ